jgi:hypothetical protein
MKVVFEPTNSLEGHMLQDLLRQRGIASRLEGAGLQGAVGELPAIGLVRLLVEDKDFGAARAVVDDWEKATVPDPAPAAPRQRVGAVAGGAIGIVLGLGAAILYFRVPGNVEGFDHNDDGNLDERWKSSAGGIPIANEIDRNFDGAIDLVWNLNRYGQAESGKSDDDFNGTFETEFRLQNGQPYLYLVDTDGDGTADLKSVLKYGVLVTQEHRSAQSREPVRIERFRLGKLVSADVDTDRDGILDRRLEYDAFGEVTAAREIRPSE